MSSVSSVLTIWTCDDLGCVAVRYDDPRRLAVQLWKGNHTLLDKPCADAAEVAIEADRLLDACCPPRERPLPNHCGSCRKAGGEG